MQALLLFVSRETCEKKMFLSLLLVPENCSGAFQRLIEALFITHAQTKLNIIGHLDGSVTTDNYHPTGLTSTRMITDRGQWCTGLVHPFSSSN